MGKPDAPQPPNPLTTAAAQTSTNVQSAVANAFLNNTNQTTPYGTLTYTPTSTYSWTDPTTSQVYSIPRFTASQVLSPQGQAIQSQTEGAQLKLAGMANAQAGRISGLLSSNIDLSGAPTAGSAQGFYDVPGARTDYASGGPIQRSLNLTGASDPTNIRLSYGPADNFSADRQRVEDALMARINPQLDIQKNQLQQQLADQGIRYGSDAYNNAMFTYNQQANDARMSAIMNAGQEQQRLTQEAGAQAAFQNAAQQQGYEQVLGQGGFANQAQAAANQQAAGAASFYNTGIAQLLQQQQMGFNAAQAARNQYMQEAYAQRNQPINEITSLLSGSQVSQPNFINTAGAQIPTTDIAGLVNQNFNQQQQNYQTQTQQYNTLVGGILGLGAGALKLSDEREKEDVHEIGSILTSDEKELPIYSYRYKASGLGDIGPMAQDLEEIMPAAVHHIQGRKFIDPGHVMGNILRAA